MLSLKGKTGYFKVLGKSKRKGNFQIAYCLKNIHRTYVVQHDRTTNHEQISGFWGRPILSSPWPLSTKKWLNRMIQSRLSFIARCYFQDLSYVTHNKEVLTTPNWTGSKQISPENSPRKHKTEKIKPLKPNHKIGSHIWPLSLKSHSDPWGGGDGHRWSGRRGE